MKKAILVISGVMLLILVIGHTVAPQVYRYTFNKIPWKMNGENHWKDRSVTPSYIINNISMGLMIFTIRVTKYEIDELKYMSADDAKRSLADIELNQIGQDSVFLWVSDCSNIKSRYRYIDTHKLRNVRRIQEFIPGYLK